METLGAFVLLDTTLPEERLKMIVGQTGAMVALANPGTLQMCRQLAEDLEVLLVHMPLLDAMVQTVPFSQNHVKTSSQHSNAAYVMFTSGSTGKPKGVVVEHSQLATFSAECGKRLEYTSTSRVFQFSSYSLYVMSLPSLRMGESSGLSQMQYLYAVFTVRCSFIESANTNFDPATCVFMK